MPLPVGAKPRPYRDFLTPALHRHFVHASVLSLCFCYIPAILTSHSGVLWRFISPFTFFKVIILFIICCMGVLLIRLARQHVGQPTTIHISRVLKKAVLDPTAYFAVATYFLSALFYGEVYVLNASPDSRIALVFPETHDERARLNERGILFRSLFPILAFVQVYQHIYHNLDRLKIPAQKTAGQASKLLNQVLNPRVVASLAVNALMKSSLATVIGFFAYFGFYRYTLWNFWFNILRSFYHFPQNSALRKSSLDGGLYVAFRFTFAAFLLTSLWDFTNHLFSEFMLDPPLKRDQPITNDSKDPNGSLINGLQAKQQFVKTQAFWELAIISDRFDQRRQSVYAELDRSGGSTWSQICALCLAELGSIDERITTFNAPPSSAPPPPTAPERYGTLDKNAKQDASIYSARKPRPGVKGFVENKIQDFANSQITRPGATNPPVALIEYGADRILTNEQRANLNADGVQSAFEGLVKQALLTPLGLPFRQTFNRQATSVICGSPYSRSSIIVDAITSLSKLAVHSLTEDSPGQVQKHVATIARSMAATIKKIEGFLAQTQPHWTDVYFTQSGRRHVPEVVAVVDALKQGLEEIVRAFGEYFAALKVSPLEQAEWKGLVKTRQSPAIKEAGPTQAGPTTQAARPRTPPMQQVRGR